MRQSACSIHEHDILSKFASELSVEVFNIIYIQHLRKRRRERAPPLGKDLVTEKEKEKKKGKNKTSLLGRTRRVQRVKVTAQLRVRIHQIGDGFTKIHFGGGGDGLLQCVRQVRRREPNTVRF
jgi:hypothetical protein